MQLVPRQPSAYKVVGHTILAANEIKIDGENHGPALGAGDTPATTGTNQRGRIPNCAKRNEYSSASCLIRSLNAVPIP